MKYSIWLTAVFAAGLVFIADGAFAKEKKGGGKKKKGQSAEVAKPVPAVGESAAISGTIVVEGDVVKLVGDDKVEYLLAASAAAANKGNNGQKVTIKGTVTTIEGKKWLAADAGAAEK